MPNQRELHQPFEFFYGPKNPDPNPNVINGKQFTWRSNFIMSVISSLLDKDPEQVTMIQTAPLILQSKNTHLN